MTYGVWISSCTAHYKKSMLPLEVSQIHKFLESYLNIPDLGYRNWVTFFKCAFSIFLND